MRSINGQSEANGHRQGHANGHLKRTVLALPQNSGYAYGILYARLSDTRNAEEISIQRQIDNGHLYFKKHNIPHDCQTDHFVEPPGHRSGWSEKQRPEYRRMRLDIPKREGRGVLWCQAQERFTRAEDATTVIRHWIEDIGVDLVFDNDVVSLATFAQWMAVHTRSYIHSMESRLGSERMHRYYKKFYDSGAEHRRHALFGLKIVGKGAERKSVANPPALRTVVKFLKLYATGKVGAGTRGVANARAAGLLFQTKQHQPRKAVELDLRSIILNLESYKPFLTADLYKQCLKVRAARKHGKANSRPLTHPPVLLRGIATCAKCKHRLRQFSNPAKNHYSYRHPQNPACPYDGKFVTARLIDPPAAAQLRTLADLDAETRQHIIELLTTAPADVEGERRWEERKVLVEARQRLLTDWLTAGLTPEEFRDKRAEIDAALEKLPQQMPLAVSAMSTVEAEAMFDELPARLARLDEFPEEANDLARQWFRSAEVSFKTRKVKCKFAWE